MINVLYVPVYPGELGWEIINYVPYVNYIFSQKEYSEVHVVVRSGREALYPMGTHFYPISLSSETSMANNGPIPPPNKIAHKLEKRGLIVDTVKVPTGGMKYCKHRSFIKYNANAEHLQKWRGLPTNSVVLAVRGRKYGSHKNWDTHNWVKLCKHLISKNFTPILTGLRESVIIDCSGCIDLTNQTTIADLLAIMKLSLLVIGQSTGPMHLASLSGVPHVVWGSARIAVRYTNSWNPHNTIVKYCSCENNFLCSYESVKSMVDTMIDELGINYE